MAIAVTSIGTGQSKSTTATSTTATWAVNDFVIVVTSSRSTLTSVTLAGAGSGGASLSLTKDKENANGTSLYGAIWRGKVLTAVGTATGVVITNAASTAKACTVYKVTGIQDSPLDKNAGATGSSTSPSSGATAALAQADELVIGSVATLGPSGDTAGTWTTGTSNVSGNEQRLGTTGSTSTTNATASSAAEIVSATTAQTAAKTSITSRAWAASIVTYLGVADTVPADPTSAHTDSKTATTVVMHWTDNATNETDYHMFKNDVDIAQIAAGSVSYEFTGLSPSTQYDLAVKAHNSAGYSAEAQLTETTNALPAAPTSAHTDSKTDVQIVMHWTDNATDETGYKIYKNTTYIETIAADSVSYTFTGLTASTQYTLEVCATNANGDSTKAQLIETTTAELGTTVYEQNTTQNSNAQMVWKNHPVVQTFSPQTAHYVYKVKLQLSRMGTLTGGTLRVSINGIYNVSPSTIELAYATMSASTISTSPTIYTFTFNTQPTLFAGATYVIVVQCDIGDNSNSIAVFMNYSSTTDVYTRGKVSLVSWSRITSYDLAFDELDSADTVYEHQDLDGGFNYRTIETFPLYTQIGQTFTVTTAHTIAKVKLVISKIGSPTGTYRISIQTTSSYLPTGIELAYITGDVSTLPTSPTLTTFTLVSGYALSAATMYAIVVSLSGQTTPSDWSNSIAMNYYSTTDNYAGGNLCELKWRDASAYSDFYFQELGDVINGFIPTVKINVGDVFKTVDTSAIKINIGDLWKTVVGLKINIGDIWKPIAWSGSITLKSLSYYGVATALSTARYQLSAASVGNYALFGSGYYNISVVDAYDAALTRSTPTAASGLAYSAATTIGNYALFGGGTANGYMYSAVFAYDTSLTRSTPTGLSLARAYHAAATVGNYALFGGGLPFSGVRSAVVDAYDLSLTQSTPTALSSARSNLAATTLGIYALFGGGITDAPSYSAVVDAYNTSLTRSTPTVLSLGRRNLAAATADIYALFSGGEYSGNYSIIDVYDTSLVRSSPIILSAVRKWIAATSFKQYAIFGGGYTGSAASAVVEAFDNLLMRTIATVLSSARYELAATSIGDYVLFGGGYTGAAASAVVDVYQVT
jgi:hypothetical protein